MRFRSFSNKIAFVRVRLSYGFAFPTSPGDPEFNMNILVKLKNINFVSKVFNTFSSFLIYQESLFYLAAAAWNAVRTGKIRRTIIYHAQLYWIFSQATRQR